MYAAANLAEEIKHDAGHYGLNATLGKYIIFQSYVSEIINLGIMISNNYKIRNWKESHYTLKQNKKFNQNIFFFQFLYIFSYFPVCLLDFGFLIYIQECVVEIYNIQYLPHVSILHYTAESSKLLTHLTL